MSFLNTTGRTRWYCRWLPVAVVLMGCGFPLPGWAACMQVGVSVTPAETWYCAGDTVILMITVSVPEGYVLIGNPKGPGVGRPMYLRGISEGNFLSWLEFRKPAAQKYGPPFGEWVWTYSGTVRFFGLGVIPGFPGRVLPDSICGSVELEALVCSNQCRLITESIPFTVRTGRAVRSRNPPSNRPSWLDELKASSPMFFPDR